MALRICLPRTRPRRSAAIGVLAVGLLFVTAPFLIWPFISEGVSDQVAYSLIRPGWTRRDVEQALAGWKREALDTDAPADSARTVRYRWLLGIYVSVTYDKKKNVSWTNCNG